MESFLKRNATKNISKRHLLKRFSFSMEDFSEGSLGSRNKFREFKNINKSRKKHFHAKITS